MDRDSIGKPYISVVIPAFNEERYIADCISSVKAQVVDKQFEIIVVDNASEDRTSEIAKAEGVKVIFEKNKGLSYARQAGLDLAKGLILVYFDADTRIPQGWLQTIIDYLEAHTNVVGVCGNFRYYDGRWIDNLSLFLFQKIIVPIVIMILRVFGKPDIFFGPNMVLRTDALRMAGGVNRDFKFYGEDAGIAQRLGTQGKVRLLQNKFVTTSARRLQKKNAIKTQLFYFISFLLIQFGKYKKVASFSQTEKY